MKYIPVTVCPSNPTCDAGIVSFTHWLARGRVFTDWIIAAEALPWNRNRNRNIQVIMKRRSDAR